MMKTAADFTTILVESGIDLVKKVAPIAANNIPESETLNEI